MGAADAVRTTGRQIMAVYMVERNLSGISMEALAGAQQQAIKTAAGTDVSYLRSVFAPQDGRCFCLFDGPSEDAVKSVNDAAGLPYERVVPAMDLPRP
jgi:hypothetical protein